jgi:hypothetical protein
MNARRSVLIAAMFGCLGLTACAQDVIHPIGAPLVDSHFGEAVKKAQAMQVIHPEGVEADDPGYSGKAAHNAIERYDMPASNSAARASAPQSEGKTKAPK